MTDRNELLATPRNMAKVPKGAFAYSPITFERYSATPGDYWYMPDDEPLRDSEGEPMVLAFASEKVSIVEAS